MFEFGLGLILAALFVAAYLLITTFLRRDRQELGGLRPQVTLYPLDSMRSIGSGKSRQALTSGDASEHRSSGTKHGSGEDGGSKQ